MQAARVSSQEQASDEVIYWCCTQGANLWEATAYRQRYECCTTANQHRHVPEVVAVR